MEQLDLFSAEPTEQWVYDILLESLKPVIMQNNANIEKLSLKKGKLYSSVWFNTQMAFRICCRNSQHYFVVSDAWATSASRAILNTIAKSNHNDGFTNFEFQPNIEGVQFFGDFLSSVLDMAIDSIPKQFDCCSRYEECSDAKKCTNPNPDMAVLCGYRKIMKRDRFFYGKNRNVD